MTIRSTAFSTCLAALFAALPTARSASAQRMVDPSEKIMDQVADQMQQIDKFLLETARDPARGAAAGEAMKANVKRIDELLQQTSGAQGSVIQSIDELIQEMEKQSQQGQGQSSQEPPQSEQQSEQERQQQREQREQQGQPQQGQPQPGQRTETSTPDQANRPEGQQEGEQPQPGEQQANGTEQSDQPGQNRETGTAPTGGEERVDRQPNGSTWGKLPTYLGFLKQYGGTPEVPARYKRLFDAYMKSHSGQSGRRAPASPRRR